ncbi:MAG: PIN domain-containing protein [Candidatus Thermoplasmatota archaeon]|jgi:predicted nucleic acid-binding protein|nr:PIN domain-containing protein [Candidatus Thermoplasmatota archaeon]
MTDFLMDTVALVHYLEDNLPRSAESAVDQAERGKGSLLLPQIVLGEFIYITLKGRLNIPNPISSIGQIIDQLRGSPLFSISSMPLEAWDIFTQLKVPELHDRMIAAEALARDLPVISNDPSLASVKDLKIIWK